MLKITERQGGALRSRARQGQLDTLCSYLAQRVPALATDRATFVGKVQAALSFAHDHRIFGDRECTRLAALWLLAKDEPAGRAGLTQTLEQMADPALPSWAKVDLFEEAIIRGMPVA